MSTFWGQTASNFLRRIVQFVRQPRQQFMILLPFFNILIYVMIINSLTKQISKDVTNILITLLFPILLVMGICLTSGVYLVTSVTDRSEKLRYLLNFGGMRSIPYFLGLFLADYLIFFIPSSLFVLLVVILDITAFKDSAGYFFISLICFGLGFVNLSNLIGFTFRDAASSFKYGTYWMYFLGFGVPFGTLILAGFLKTEESNIIV